MTRRVARRAFDDYFAIAKYVMVRRCDQGRLAAFQRAEMLRLGSGRWWIREHHVPLDLSYEPRRAGEQVGVANVVPVKMRKRQIRDVGRRVADFVQLRLELLGGRGIAA